jgi:hypothetical protein
VRNVGLPRTVAKGLAFKSATNAWWANSSALGPCCMFRLAEQLCWSTLISACLVVIVSNFALAQRTETAEEAVVGQVDARRSEFCDERLTRVANVLCYGARGDRRTDDTAAINNAIEAALRKRIPLLLPSGKYRVTSTIHLDYAVVARQGFQFISQNAFLDGTSIADAPVLRIDCSTDACFYFHVSGPLTVLARTTAYAVVVGRPDFADAHNSIKIASLIVNNNGKGGGTQFNYVLAGDVYINSVSAGTSGLALNQTVFTKISGALSGGKVALSLENAYSYSNTFISLDLEESPLCLSISSPKAHNNTFVSTLMNCPTGIRAIAGHSNLLINPMWGGAATTRTQGVTGLVFLPALP